MTSSDSKIKEIDDKIKRIDDKIKKKDAEIAGQSVYPLRTQGELKSIEIKKIQLDGDDDDATVKDVLVHLGMLLAPISEKSALVTEKSSLITEKLSLSVDRLYNSSKRLERYSAMLIFLTILLSF